MVIVDFALAAPEWVLIFGDPFCDLHAFLPIEGLAYKRKLLKLATTCESTD